MSYTNTDNFTSFLIWMLLISFSCLIVQARTISIMLTGNGKSEHPCLVPDFRGNVISFSILSMMLSVGLSYMAFITLK